MDMENLILFIFTVVPIYHGKVLPQNPSKKSRFCAISVRAIIFELDYSFCFLVKWLILLISYGRMDIDED